jgi:hypothetical protein
MTTTRDDILAALRAAPAVSDVTPEQLLDRYDTEVLAEAVARLMARADELSALADEEMSREQADLAQEWYEAAEIVRRLIPAGGAR